MKTAKIQEQAVQNLSGLGKDGYTRRQCNLCKNLFIMRSKFDRFCGTCKSEKELFRFAEWLPNLPIAI